MTKKYRVKVSCPGFKGGDVLEANDMGDLQSYHNIYCPPENWPGIFEEVPEPEPESEFVEVEIEKNRDCLMARVPEDKDTQWEISVLAMFPAFVGFKFEGSEQVYAYSRGWQDHDSGNVYPNSGGRRIPVTANRAVFRRQA